MGFLVIKVRVAGMIYLKVKEIYLYVCNTLTYYSNFINQIFLQRDSSGSRIFVHDSVYDEFVAMMVEKVKKIRVGDPFDENTDQGPQIDRAQMNKILGNKRIWLN